MVLFQLHKVAKSFYLDLVSFPKPFIWETRLVIRPLRPTDKDPTGTGTQTCSVSSPRLGREPSPSDMF